MHQFIKCCYAEFKKGMTELPYAFIGTIVLCLILGTVAFCAARLLYRTEDFSKSDVAVVTNDTEDSYLNFALNLIRQTDSASLALDFHLMSKAEAETALQKHQVIAVLFLPDDLIDGILNGSNPPVRVLFSADDTMSSVFLTEMTLAGARLLSGAQADIYTAGMLYNALGRQDALPDAYDDINIRNLNYALNREKLFSPDTTNLNGSLNTEIFYLATGILLILFFITTAFTAMLRRERRDFYHLLFSRNISSLQYLLAKIISFTLLFFLLQLLFYLTAANIPGLKSIEGLKLRFHSNILAFFLINGLILSTYANLIFLLARDSSGGILLTYCISSLMTFCSGCIIPAAFFPSGTQKLFSVFPTFYMHQGIIALLEGRRMKLLTPYLFYPVILFILCAAVFEYRRRYDKL